MTNLPNLIAQVESAEGPSWKLECDIALVLGWRDCIPCDFQGIKSRTGGLLRPPNWTASIDAALSLADDARAPEILLDAIDHNRNEADWVRHLPRYIVAACLKAKGAEHVG